MGRRSRTVEEAPAPSASEDAVAVAEQQASADAALLAALQARDAEPPQQTIADQYNDIIDLIATAKRRTRLSEATLIKAWELNLMWVLNNRQQPQPQYPNFDYADTPNGGSEAEENGEDVLPVPNEVLGGDEPSSEE